MRRRLTTPLAALAAGAVVVAVVAIPAAAAPAPLRLVARVAGTAGSAAQLALATDGSRGYLVDGSPRIAAFDTATSAVFAHSVDFDTEGFGLPTDLSPTSDGAELYVSTTGGWIVRLAPDASLISQIGLPGTALAGVSAVAGGATAVAAPSAADPTRILRFNIGVSSVSPIDFAPDAVGSPRPSSLASIATAPGNGSDNEVLVAGTAAGSGVLYVFADPFALGGQARTVLLPGTTAAGEVSVNDAGTRAAVTAPAEQRVFVVDIDAASAGYGSIVATATLAHRAAAVVFAPDGATLDVVGDDAVSTVDAASGTVIDTVTFDIDDASAVLTSASGNRLWVGDAAQGDVDLLSRAALTVTSSTPAPTVGAAFSLTLAASSFDIAPTFAVSPALPDGLVLDAATGAITGTPVAAQDATDYAVTATATDGTSATTVVSVTIVAAPSPSPTPTPTQTTTPTPAPSPSGSGTSAAGGTTPTLAATGGPDLSVAALLALTGVLVGGILIGARRALRR